MKIVFVSNFLSHHQIPLCEALQKKSSFFKFFVGENEIEYGAEENVTNLEVYFNYNPLVL